MTQGTRRLLDVEEVTDPAEVSEARIRREKFDRNFAWFHAHAPQVYEAHRGEFICVAGQEAFAAATPQEAVAKATDAHPADEGRFVQYIPAEKMARVYDNQR